MKTPTKEEWQVYLSEIRSAWKEDDTAPKNLMEVLAAAVATKLAELQGECLWCGVHRNCDSAMHRSCWDTLRGRQAKDVADARLQALVNACKAVCLQCAAWTLDPNDLRWADECWCTPPSPCRDIRARIAAHHAERDPKPKCEHKESLAFDFDASNLNVPTGVRCSCGMVRKLGPWEEKNAKKS